MSADTVIDAIVAWCGPPHIIGLNKLWDAVPWFDGAGNWQIQDQLGWGAVGYIHLAHEDERRIAMGGSRGGIKQVTNDVAIATQFKFVMPASFDPDTGPSSYRRALNQLLDGIRGRIRADRTLGTAPGLDGLGGIDIDAAGSILQVGEGDGAGGPDIVVDRDLPRRDNQVLWSWNSVGFKVIELAAT